MYTRTLHEIHGQRGQHCHRHRRDAATPSLLFCITASITTGSPRGQGTMCVSVAYWTAYRSMYTANPRINRPLKHFRLSDSVNYTFFDTVIVQPHINIYHIRIIYPFTLFEFNLFYLLLFICVYHFHFVFIDIYCV